MKKLCFASYAKVLTLCKAVGVTQTSLIAQVIISFCGEKNAWNIDNSATISDLVSGKKNLPSYAPSEARSCNPADVVKTFSDKIIHLIDDNKLRKLVLCLKDIIRNDTDIEDTTIVDLVSNKTKAELLSTKVANIPEFLVGVLLYTAKNTNKEGSKQTISSITQEYINSFTEQCFFTQPELDKGTQQTDVFPMQEEFLFDDITKEKARQFCIKYEEDLSLLPLCEIAAEVHSEHKHLRPIFTAYIKQSKNTQKAILVRKQILPFEFINRNWIADCIDCFEKDIKEKGLTTVRFLYDGAKYFHRAFDSHSAYNPKVINPFIFKRTYVSGPFQNTPGDLSSVIDDYIHGKEKHPNDSNTPPFDILWYGLNLANAKEDYLCFWICRFIIDTCHFFYGYNPNQKYDAIWDYKDCIDDNRLKTLEDLYYYALFLLYMSYGRKEITN